MLNVSKLSNCYHLMKQLRNNQFSKMNSCPSIDNEIINERSISLSDLVMRKCIEKDETIFNTAMHKNTFLIT